MADGFHHASTVRSGITVSQELIVGQVLPTKGEEFSGVWIISYQSVKRNKNENLKLYTRDVIIYMDGTIVRPSDI